mgnify:CR=1 FL=1
MAKAVSRVTARRRSGVSRQSEVSNALWIITASSVVWLGLVGCATKGKLKSGAAKAKPTVAQSAPKTHAAPLVTAMPPSSEMSDPKLEKQKSIWADVLEAQKKEKWTDVIQGYLEMADTETDQRAQQQWVAKAMNLVSTKLSLEDLDDVSSDSDFGAVRAFARFLLGEKAFERRDFSTARKHFSAVVSLVPESDLAVQAKPFLQQIEAIDEVEPYTIGTVLPLSGRNANIGQRALRGLQMGLGLHKPKSKFRLAIADSEGNSDLAALGVQRLLVEDKVMAIVGSVLSRTAAAVAAKANSLGIPSLALSQKASVTEIGPTVFTNSVTAELQVRQLVRTAFQNKMRKFAILYPNDAYGVEFANAFWDEVLARGGEITSVQSYDPKATDFRYVVQRLVGKFYIEARSEEYKLKGKELEAKHKNEKKSARDNSEEDLLDPVQDFDAIFIPDSTRAMGQMSAFLSFAGVRAVKLLGTNLWNNGDLVKRAGNFKDNLIFVDSPRDGLLQSSFAKEFKQIYGEDPSIIEAQAYDAGLLLSEAIDNQGARSRKALADTLKTLENTKGSTGLLHMGSFRSVDRPMVSYTLMGGQILPTTKQ